VDARSGGAGADTGAMPGAGRTADATMSTSGGGGGGDEVVAISFPSVRSRRELLLFLRCGVGFAMKTNRKGESGK